jgi:uncharacterized membrane protein
MREKKKLRLMVLAAFFTAIEVVLVMTPVGMIPIGPIRATTMHIPVILAGVLAGPGFGAGIGLVFGLLSLAKNTFEPTVTSFVFSPFITVGGVQGNFWSLLIVLGPRVLMGWLSGAMQRRVNGKKQKALYTALIAGGNTMLHTLLVMGGIWAFFLAPYAAARAMSAEAATAAILAVIGTNGVLETALAAGIVPLLARALRPAAERMGIDEQ